MRRLVGGRAALRRPAGSRGRLRSVRGGRDLRAARSAASLRLLSFSSRPSSRPECGLGVPVLAGPRGGPGHRRTVLCFPVPHRLPLLQGEGRCQRVCGRGQLRGCVCLGLCSVLSQWLRGSTVMVDDEKSTRLNLAWPDVPN